MDFLEYFGNLGDITAEDSILSLVFTFLVLSVDIIYIGKINMYGFHVMTRTRLGTYPSAF